MLTSLEKSSYREACIQTEAIFALEGLEPTAQSRLLDRDVLDGKVTPEQVKEELLAYVKQHKTVKGFYASRSWA